MTDHEEHGAGRGTTWFGHREFVRGYETFLHAVYDHVAPAQRGVGRGRLVERLRSELRVRNARKVLDCAAGTGFPSLELRRKPPITPFIVHCTDGDQAMIDELANRARNLGIGLDELAPPAIRATTSQVEPAHLCLDWQDLDRLDTTYDYVLCRGNSLAYDHSWTGGREVATTTQVTAHLTTIARRVRPGGWLHVDAPWQLGLGSRTYETSRGDIVQIREQVSELEDRRKWRLTYVRQDATFQRFERFSSQLTVLELSPILDELGFEQTRPRSLDEERENFGVIIARKPRR